MGWPKSTPLIPEARLPRIVEGLRLHWGFALAILSAVIVWVIQTRTTLGFEIRAVGQNPEAARFAGMPVNAVLVKLAPGADGAQVAQHIGDWLYFNVYTSDEERSLMLEGKLSRMSAVLGLFRVLLILVSIVIIALIIYVLTIEKIKSIATLKLIGASNWVIVRLIMEQSMALTLASFAVAYGLRELIAPGFPRTLAFLAQETAVTFAVMLVGGVVASLMAIWHALRTPPQLALGG